MQAGLFLAPGHDGEPVDELVEQATLAERLGYDFVGLGDSQSIFKELHTSLGLVANQTERIDIGPAVTNPVTRHPAVTASALCTAAELSDGRALLGIGTGDSGVHTLGKTPAKLAELKETIETIRALFEGEPVEYEGSEIELRWLQESELNPDVPIFMAAEGPKTLEMAGELADGVFIGTGLFPELIQDSVERVNAGARAAGRDPQEVTKWIMARANIAEERADAVEEIKMQLAASANHAFRYSLEGKQVPDEHRDAIRRLQEEYDPHEHETLQADTHDDLVDELGLTEYLADRFAIVGTADDCIAKLRDIDSVAGVDGVFVPVYHEDKRRFITRFAEDVLAQL